jgi:galactokinase
MAPSGEPAATPPDLVAAIQGAFRESYGYPPQHLFRAPGRVNLIGEHTDYNDGFVLPMAIDRAVWAAAAARPDRSVRILAVTLGRQVHTASLDNLHPDLETRWANYALGVLAMLERAGHRLGGLDLAYAGDVPIGAGLSSSAAVEVAVAIAARDLFGLDLPDLELARICQQAEHEFAGTQCGLMDQIISVAGQEGHALLIDCRHLTWQPVPLPPGVGGALSTRPTTSGGPSAKRRPGGWAWPPCATWTSTPLRREPPSCPPCCACAPAMSSTRTSAP